MMEAGSVPSQQREVYDMATNRAEWLAKLCFSLSLAAMLSFVGLTILGLHAALADARGLADNLGVAVISSAAFMVGAFLLALVLRIIVVMAHGEAKLLGRRKKQTTLKDRPLPRVGVPVQMQ